MINTKDIIAQTDLVLSENTMNVNGFYFVVAHTDSGTRFYSDPVATFDKAEQVYNQYIDVINYFNGGNIQLYKINDDDFEVISYSKV